jgi:hypothetical protein
MEMAVCTDQSCRDRGCRRCCWSAHFLPPPPLHPFCNRAVHARTKNSVHVGAMRVCSDLREDRLGSPRCREARRPIVLESIAAASDILHWREFAARGLQLILIPYTSKRMWVRRLRTLQRRYLGRNLGLTVLQAPQHILETHASKAPQHDLREPTLTTKSMTITMTA